MTEITRAIAGVTPYAGYFGDVTGDYFFNNGLRGTHNAVFDGMSPATQQAVQPYMPDFKPLGDSTPQLLQELSRATLGALGNYFGDMYRGSGRAASTEVRREVAVGSTLIMAMLEADETMWRQSSDTRDVTNVTTFYAQMKGAVTGEAKRLPFTSDFAPRPHRAALLLGREINTRVIGADEDQKAALVDGVHGLALARHTQLKAGQADIEQMVATAHDLGATTARMVLGLTTLRPEVKAAPLNPAGAAAIALGEIGAIITHGTHVDAAFRNKLPTYATATVMKAGGPTKQALASIEERRRDTVNDLVEEGKEALSDSTRQSRGIFRMAVRLLGIRQGFGGIGSAEAIEQHMRLNYWRG